MIARRTPGMPMLEAADDSPCLQRPTRVRLRQPAPASSGHSPAAPGRSPAEPKAEPGGKARLFRGEARPPRIGHALAMTVALATAWLLIGCDGEPEGTPGPEPSGAGGSAGDATQTSPSDAIRERIREIACRGTEAPTVRQPPPWRTWPPPIRRPTCVRPPSPPSGTCGRWTKWTPSSALWKTPTRWSGAVRPMPPRAATPPVVRAQPPDGS